MEMNECLENSILNRQVGLQEDSLISQNATIVNIAYTKGHIYNKDYLKEALKAATDLHPNLRINLDKTKTPYEWRSVSNPYIEPKMIISESEEEWKDVVHTEMNDRFILFEDRPLFRFTLVQYKENAHLLTQYDHSIGDGVGGMILTNSILTYYSQIYNGEKIEVKSLTFLPSLEELAFPNGLNENDNKLIEELTRNIFNLKKDWTPHLKIQYKLEDYNKNYALFHDGKEENLKLIKDMCKKHGVTVGSVLTTAIFFIIAKFYKNDWEINPTIHFDIDIEVNVRDRLPKKLGKVDLSLLFLMITVNSDVNIYQTFWELCKIIHEKIKQSLGNDTHFYQPYASDILETYPEIIENKKRKEENLSNFNLTNIGPYPFNPVYKLWDGKEIVLDKLNCVGATWCSIYTGYVLVAHSVKYISYGLVYDELPENEEMAKLLFPNLVNLVESSHDLETFTLSDFINSKN